MPLSPARILVVLLLYCTLPLACPLASMCAAAPQQAPAVIPDSADGLQSQLESIFNAARNHDAARYDSLASSLRVPEGSQWFATTFGETAGSHVASNYAQTWEIYESQLSPILQEAAGSRLRQVVVKTYGAGSPPPADSFFQGVLRDVRNSAAFYTVDMAKGQEASTMPGVYVYVQGAFRVVNWASFYGLPGVTPIRIRVSYRVAMSQLIHEVKPVRSDEARKEHLRGPVAVHIIIDRDGIVSQAALVSGPQLLGKDAIEAVRQWQFKPTWLNGDPVEVDTTITIPVK